MDTYGWIEFSMGLFTLLVAVPVYIIFLYMIVRFRKLPQFNIPFYGLVFQCGLVDLWYVVHQYLLFNHFLINLIPQLFLWARMSIASTIFYGFFYIRACQTTAVLMISVNRFTALVMPLRHDLIWSRKLTWMTIVSQHIIASMLMVPALASDCLRDFVMDNYTNEYKLNTVSPHCIPRLGGPSAGFATLLSIILFFLYSVMFVKVRTDNVAVGHGNQTENERKVQRGLAVSGAVISLTLVLNTCFLLVAMISLSRFSYVHPTVMALRSVVNTIFCIINPFVLLCFGSSVRPYYWKCIKKIACIKESQPAQIDKQRVDQHVPGGHNQQHNHNNVIEQSL